MVCDLDKPHGLADEVFRGFGEKGIMGLAVNGFAADLNRHSTYSTLNDLVPGTGRKAGAVRSPHEQK